MNGTFRSLSALAIAFSMNMAVAPAYSEGKEKTKAKGKQDAEASGKHGPSADDMQYGLERVCKRKGNLPSRLQKKKGEDGSLTRGLEQGGKKMSSRSKVRKGASRAS